MEEPRAPNGGANTTWRSSLLPRPVVSVAPSAHDFGSVLVGGESAPLTVTVGNTGCASLAVGTVSLTGADPGEFELRNDGVSEATIPPTSPHTLQGVVKPTSPGAKAATLQIPSNAPGNPVVTVSLTGTGVPSPFGERGRALRRGRGDPPDLQATAGVTVRIFPAKGDVNGDGRIDLVDLRLAHPAALGLLVLSPEELDRADLDGNGVVDMEDVALLCQLILGGCG